MDAPTRLECRFYEEPFPEIESLVMVNVRNIAEMGAYVTLLEYNNIEGMILLSELSRRRIRSINKLIRVNRNEVVMVLRVDKEKGYIDLSKRRVSPEDVAKCEERYNKAKAVHRVMRHVADRQGKSLENLYEIVGWPLYKKYGHAYDALKLCLTGENDDVFEACPEMDGETKTCLVDYVKKKLSPQPIKIRADIEVTCFAYEGINAIKEALIQGQEKSVDECPIQIKLIAPPMYVMTTMTLDKELGIQVLTSAIATVTESISSKGGNINVKMLPKVVSAGEETELQAMMDRLAQEGEEGKAKIKELTNIYNLGMVANFREVFNPPDVDKLVKSRSAEGADDTPIATGNADHFQHLRAASRRHAA